MPGKVRRIVTGVNAAGRRLPLRLFDVLPASPETVGEWQAVAGP
jgi:hypothetical protein